MHVLAGQLLLRILFGIIIRKSSAVSFYFILKLSYSKTYL